MEKPSLAPLFNFAPSHLLIDDISRSLEWVNEKGEILDDWNEIIGTLDLPDEERHPMKNELKRFSEKLAFLSDIMKKRESTTTSSKPATTVSPTCIAS